METIIEKLLELDFDALSEQPTQIVLNQANTNSVVFNYRIYKGSNEISYTEYSRAELVFRKTDGANVIEDGLITAGGISYVLNSRVFDIAGIVTGQVNLYNDNTLCATLHYSFRIIPDLANIKRVSQVYVGALEQLVAELNVTVDEARRILEGLQGEAFATEQFVLEQIELCLEGLHSEGFATEQFVSEQLESVEERISENYQESLFGALQASENALTAAQNAQTRADSTSNPNILHNWDFQVNQRGQPVYQGGYSIDRWTLHSTSTQLTMLSNGINLKRASSNSPYTGITQYIEFPTRLTGLTLTLSAHTSKGYHKHTVSLPTELPTEALGTNFVLDSNWNMSMYWEGATANKLRFQIYAASNSPVGTEIDLYRVKLEIGGASTLANDPPMDYGVELAKCQRYQLTLGVADQRLRAVGITANEVLFYLPVPITLRINPSYSGVLELYSAGMVLQTGFSFSLTGGRSNVVRISAAKTAHGLTDAILRVGENLLLDANL